MSLDARYRLLCLASLFLVFPSDSLAWLLCPDGSVRLRMHLSDRPKKLMDSPTHVRSRGKRLRMTSLAVVVLAACAIPAVLSRRATDPLKTARELVLQGRTEEALDLLNRQLQSDPEDDARLLYATLAAETEPDRALEQLRLIEPGSEKASEAARAIDDLIFRLEEHDLAEPVLEDLCRRHAEDASLKRLLAGVLIRSRKGHRAMDVLQEALELEPNSVDGLLLLADAYDSVGRRTYMIEPLRRVVELEPDSYIAHANLAYAERFASELQAAEQDARWCLERRPYDVKMRLLLARILRDQGQQDAALEECRRAAAVDPDDPDCRVLQAQLLMHERKFERVLEILSPLVRFARDSPEIRTLIRQAREMREQARTGVPSTASLTGIPSVAPITFADVAAEAGVTFRHWSPLTPERHLHLVMGSGAGWLDLDHDHWPDLLLGQGRAFSDEVPLAEGSADSDGNRRAFDRLYRNIDGTSFVDVTGTCGLKNPDYTMGIACGDWNDDGFTDLFVSCFGPNRLYVNRGDGTFDDVSDVLGANPPAFSASATWGDINGDGLIDLFVTNYIDVDPYDYKLCRVIHDGQEVMIGCHPHYEQPVPDTVYLNQGDGRFLDASEQVGLTPESAKQGLGVVCSDLDGDGDLDFFVANDTVENQLWINDGGILTDQAVLSGVATNRHGEREAGMGIAIGDVTGNGLQDLFLTHFYFETNTLYRNEGNLLFLDVTDESGLGPPGRLRLGFGTSLLDGDCDGWLDLFIANGHIHTRLQEVDRTEPFEQKALMLRNQGKGQFVDVSARSGDYFLKDVVGRGVAAADFDRDGRRDLAVVHLNDDASLLRNVTASERRETHLQLVGTGPGRDAIGATLVIEANGRRQVRIRPGSSSYLSCDDGRISVCLDSNESPVDVRIIWPGGHEQRWDAVTLARENMVVQGSSTIVPLPEVPVAGN